MHFRLYGFELGSVYSGIRPFFGKKIGLIFEKFVQKIENFEKNNVIFFSRTKIFYDAAQGGCLQGVA